MQRNMNNEDYVAKLEEKVVGRTVKGAQVQTGYGRMQET